jgi:hypothetical protein
MSNKQTSFLSGGGLFVLAGLVLLVIKLAFAGTFSWWWVWGTMFFPLWMLLSAILVILAAALIVLVPAAIVWLIWLLVK